MTLEDAIAGEIAKAVTASVAGAGITAGVAGAKRLSRLVRRKTDELPAGTPTDVGELSATVRRGREDDPEWGRQTVLELAKEMPTGPTPEEEPPFLPPIPFCDRDELRDRLPENGIYGFAGLPGCGKALTSRSTIRRCSGEGQVSMSPSIWAVTSARRSSRGARPILPVESRHRVPGLTLGEQQRFSQRRRVECQRRLVRHDAVTRDERGLPVAGIDHSHARLAGPGQPPLDLYPRVGRPHTRMQYEQHPVLVHRQLGRQRLRQIRRRAEQRVRPPGRGQQEHRGSVGAERISVRFGAMAADQHPVHGRIADDRGVLCDGRARDRQMIAVAGMGYADHGGHYATVSHQAIGVHARDHPAVRIVFLMAEAVGDQ